MDFLTIAICKKLIEETMQGNGLAKGNDGRNPEYRSNDTHVQWRLVGDPAWIDLFPLSVITPEDGITPVFRMGGTGDRTLQVNYPPSADWTDLYTFAESITEQQIKGWIDDAVKDLPTEGITEDEAKALIDAHLTEKLKDLPSGGVTEQRVQEMIDAAIDGLSAGGGFTPNSNQMAAMNSGITGTWKTETDNEILRLENEKADKDDIPDITNLATKDELADAGGYEPPPGGIPESDLSTEVRGLLAKAESALQSFTETDPIYQAEKHLYAQKTELPKSLNDLENPTVDPFIRKNVMDTAFLGYMTEDDVQLAIKENMEGLLEDKGSVPNRAGLPATADNFDAYFVENEEIILFAYNSGGLNWLTLNFFVDLSLYETIAGSDAKVAVLESAINGKQNQISAGTANRVRVSSGVLGTLNELSSTIGSTQMPVYVNAGVLTALTQANLRIGIFGTAAVGSTTLPVHIAANGVATALTQADLRIGIFGTAAIGSTQMPIYIAANGVPTAMTQANLRIAVFGTAAIGNSTTRPVYIAANGVATQMGQDMLHTGSGAQTKSGNLTVSGTMNATTLQQGGVRVPRFSRSGTTLNITF